MKIAVVGTHCSGKTTAIWNLGAQLKTEGFENMIIVQEVARDCPYPMNESGTFQTAQWMMCNQMMKELAAEIQYPLVLCDRSVLDELAYFWYSTKSKCTGKTLEQYSYLNAMAKAWLNVNPYDMIFYFPPLPLKVDGGRSPNKQFQIDIDALIQEELKKAPHVTALTTEERELRNQEFHWYVKELLEYEQEKSETH